MSLEENLDREYNEIVRELSDLAVIHIKLVKRLRRVARDLNKPEENLEKLELTLDKMRILRSKLTKIINDLMNKYPEYLRIGKNVEDTELIIRFFEMSGLIEEEKVLRLMISRKPSIEGYIRRDFEEIRALRNLINRISTR
ncbi:MAG: hypothetical protein QXE32_00570 [Sulfolobales archaeon]